MAIQQSSNSNPNIQYRTPDGQTTTGPLNEAPPQIQLLYQNLPQAKAQTSSAQSGATTAEQTSKQASLNTQYLSAPQDLQTDLKNGMTLTDALAKYKPLKMKADDIFNEYLTGNTYGPKGAPKLPVESPTQLEGEGVDANSLGAVGQLGSFVDKYNTKNAVDELRNAEDYFKKTQSSDIAGNVGGVNANSKAYENARTIVGLHLSSLIPGASGAQATGNTLLDTLPSSKDLRSYTPDMVHQAFDSVEKQLMASRGYSYKDLNVTAPDYRQDSAPKSGGGLLNQLLTNGGNDLKNTATLYNKANPDVISMLTNPKARADYQDFVQNNNPIEQLKGMAGQYADIATNPIEAFKNHPVNTALAVLGPLLGLKGEGAVAEEGAVPAEATSAVSDIKGPSSLQKIINPAGAQKAVGDIRQNILNTADKQPDNTIKGEDLASQFKDWADQAKLSNLPDADAIEQAAANAVKHYAGKTLKPSDLADIKQKIEDTYTKTGVPKSATASYIDRGLSDVIDTQLDVMAPGWEKTNQLFNQNYNAQKGTAANIVKNLPKNAVKTGMNVGGLGILAKLLGL